MSLTEFDQEAYDRRRFREGVEKGREEGIFEGAQKKAMETAKQLLAMQLLTIKQIATATQLTVSEIQKLKQMQ